MYKSNLYKYIFAEVLFTIVYLLSILVGFRNIIIVIVYDVFLLITMLMAKLYMDNYNNYYIEKIYRNLYLKYKSKFYNSCRKNLLSLEIYMDRDKLKIEKDSEIYKVSKEGLYFVVYECISFFVLFMNFIYFSVIFIM